MHLNIAKELINSIVIAFDFLLRPTVTAIDAQLAPIAKKVFAFDFVFVLKCFHYINRK